MKRQSTNLTYTDGYGNSIVYKSLEQLNAALDEAERLGALILQDIISEEEPPTVILINTPKATGGYHEDSVWKLQ